MVRRLSMVIAAAVILTAGCATQLPDVPALSDSGTWLPGKVVWHDLVTPDLAGAKTFYGGLFGWSFEDVSDAYTLVRHDGRLIAGMAELRTTKYASYWVPLVSVPDVDRAVASTTGAGGERLVKPFDVPGRGRVAVLRDPQDAVFGVVRTVQGDPADRIPGSDEWLWTSDVAASGSFYRNLVGYEVATRAVAGQQYTVLERDALPRVGVLAKPSPDIGNTWVCYVKVADVDAVVAKVAGLGGSVLMAPTAEVRNGTVAIIADSHGAGLIVQEVIR
jgi:predicted enzyme related to lactoylglutathione lyase